MAKKKQVVVKRPPTVYTEKIADEICQRLSAGESLNSICKSHNMPTERAVRKWAINPNHPFSPKYAKARDDALDWMAEETLRIADDGSRDIVQSEMGPVAMPVVVARDRLKVDTRKWYLSKLAPKRYGDRLQVESENHNTNLNVNVDLMQLARDVAFMLAMADAQSIESTT